MIYDVKQDSFASTLMSSIKCAYNHYYSKELSNSMLYGLSGHAFVINITNGLGPCAPYVWNMTDFDKLTKENLGLSVFEDKNWVTNESSEEDKLRTTKEIKQFLDDGNLVLLSSYEYQVIKGYDKEYFLTTIPWDDAQHVTPDFKFNSLDGMKDFFSYFRVSKTDIIDIKKGIKNSIKYAISLFENPSSTPDSAMGSKSYDFWLEKINEENAVAHGNWWTSTVWAESRNMASKYMLEVIEYIGNEELLKEISSKYMLSYKILIDIANKENGKDITVENIKKLRKNEIQIYDLLKQIV